MKQYLDLLQDVLNNGTQKDDRTGTGTRSVFGRQVRFDLAEGLPVLTTKKLHLKSIVHELLWFISGDTNVKYLNDNGVTIWNEWADNNGELGSVYGAQWRTWLDDGGEYIDQLTNLMRSLKNNPNSRRHIISAWNVSDLPDESLTPQQNVLNGKMALPVCHCLVQFYVANGKLSCSMYQRSADIFLGVPYNITSYAIFTQMIAQQLGLELGDLIISFGDLHLYNNHIEQAKEQLKREPIALPTLNIKCNPKDIFSYKFEDFELMNYNSHPAIKAPISI